MFLIKTVPKNRFLAMQQNKDKVIAILSKYIYDKKVLENIPENPKIIDDLKINSARIVDVILDVEEAYNIEIDDKSLKQIKTLNDILNIIENKTK